jgi:hypothetical protein
VRAHELIANREALTEKDDAPKAAAGSALLRPEPNFHNQSIVENMPGDAEQSAAAGRSKASVSHRFACHPVWIS